MGTGRAAAGRDDAMANGMKGQLFSSEILVSFSIFLGAVLVYLFAWNSLQVNYMHEMADAKMQSVLLGLSDVMVLSPGDPPDWETGAGMGANSFGLAASENELSSEKLYMMQSYFASNYSGMRDSMGAAGYGVFMNVSNQDGNVLYSFGSLADTDNETVSAAEANRLAVLGGEIVNVRMQLWHTRGKGLI